MTYEVLLTKKAEQEAEDYADFIASQSHDRVASDNWWNGLLLSLASLESFPSRCPLIPEREKFRVQLRHLLYQSHRIIFEIQATEVTILRIYHSALRPLTPTRLRQTVRTSKPS